MYRWIILFIILNSFFITQNTYAASKDFVIFDQIFHDWTESFNRKDVTGSCRLFAKSVVADYQGAPQKNYSSLCDGFKKLFQKTNYRYHYRYKLHQIYHSGDLAAVRITWYLDTYENGQKISSTQDEGLDIFEKNASGEWQITYYLSYMSPGQACQWLNCY